ncbi:hypothetical protein SKAU_G00324220 [Synaphobranchus kaupii]|uniref:Uncharacterized protein n=1 Tax=Synaphobranchus kaupii TaxID=118154 RepID=A0A9Q1IK70_SYNKA|nr:hypothetical protein SKAU_G00324220 [Synaphobranchus kaupii]
MCTPAVVESGKQTSDAAGFQALSSRVNTGVLTWHNRSLGYPCLPFVMMPYPALGPQAHFSLAHRRTQARVEMSIRILKAWLQSLRGLRVSAERCQCSKWPPCRKVHALLTLMLSLLGDIPNGNRFATSQPGQGSDLNLQPLSTPGRDRSGIPHRSPGGVAERLSAREL